MTRVAGFHPAWNGDFLVASLVGQKLVRLRIEDGRVIFAEDIAVGRRIRDVHQHGSGALVLWTDSRELIFLRPSTGGFEDRFIAFVLNERMKWPKDRQAKLMAAFEGCRECHSLRPGDNTHAPSLARIFGAKVGSGKFKGYSPAMKRHNGEWSKDALTAYLKAPQKLIPGTRMPDPNIGDAEVVDGIVQLFEHLTHTLEAPPEALKRPPG
jgi:cytochrome c